MHWHKGKRQEARGSGLRQGANAQYMAGGSGASSVGCNHAQILKILRVGGWRGGILGTLSIQLR